MRKRDWLPVALLLVAVGFLFIDRNTKLPSPRDWLSRPAATRADDDNRALRNIGNAGVFFQNLEELRAENEGSAGPRR